MESLPNQPPMTPKVSVIIPTYNRPHFLREAIESVRSQTYPNLEVLVIDDGSTTPGVEAVVRPLLGEITYFKKENGGPGSAVNEGLKLAQGKYIARLDDDDLMSPDKIQRQVAFMEAHSEFGWSVHNAINVGPDGRSRVSHSVSWKWDKYGQLIGLLLTCPFPQPTVMVKKAAYDAVGEYITDLIPDDWDMWIRLAKAGYRCGTFEGYLCKYRLHGSNLSENRSPLKMGRLRPDVVKLITRHLHPLSISDLFETPIQSKPDAWLIKAAIFMKYDAFENARACLEISGLNLGDPYYAFWQAIYLRKQCRFLEAFDSLEAIDKSSELYNRALFSMEILSRREKLDLSKNKVEGGKLQALADQEFSHLFEYTFQKTVGKK